MSKAFAKTYTKEEGIKQEWVNIKWPSAKITFKQTLIVLITSLIIIGAIILSDTGSHMIIQRIFKG